MTGLAATLRAFLAVEVSSGARQGLAETLGRLRAAIPTGVRWVDPGGVHLTLKFLGDINPDLVGPILKAMTRSVQGSPTFCLRLAGLGAFPGSGQPRVLWAGLDGDLDCLRRLQQEVEGAMAELGFPQERRAFQAHLTLGRVREGAPPSLGAGLSAAISNTPLEPSDPWQVDEVHLIRSMLAPGGAVYRSLGSAPLAG